MFRLQVGVRRFRIVTVSILCLLVTAPALLCAQPPGVGSIEGLVTSQGGTIRLGGAQIVIRDAANREIATIVSESDGHFRLTAVPEGKYTVTAALEGFATMKAVVVVTADHATERSLDLPIATVTQTVEVTASASIVSAA